MRPREIVVLGSPICDEHDEFSYISMIFIFISLEESEIINTKEEHKIIVFKLNGLVTVDIDEEMDTDIYMLKSWFMPIN